MDFAVAELRGLSSWRASSMAVAAMAEVAGSTPSAAISARAAASTSPVAGSAVESLFAVAGGCPVASRVGRPKVTAPVVVVVV